MQSGGYPFHRQRRLSAQPRRQGQFRWIALMLPLQFLFCPAQPLQPLGNDPSGLFSHLLPPDAGYLAGFPIPRVALTIVVLAGPSPLLPGW